MTALTRAEQQALLVKRIEESGLSDRQFAMRVLHRDPRTIRRWLAGDRRIPRCVLDWLEKPEKHPWP